MTMEHNTVYKVKIDGAQYARYAVLYTDHNYVKGYDYDVVAVYQNYTNGRVSDYMYSIPPEDERLHVIEKIG